MTFPTDQTTHAQAPRRTRITDYLPAWLDKPLHLTALLIGVYVILTFAIYHGKNSADLSALYLAAFNYGAGNFEAIYADGSAVFNLAVPPGWEDQASAMGLEARPLFPFIYPPLWAALFAPLTSIGGAGPFMALAFLVNPLLLGLSAVLAHRIMQPRMALPVWVFLGLALVASTSIGHVALYQNQPQILVSFLILLAFERDRAGALLTAGAVLALAAPFKLYPALFAIFWLASRNYRALGAFAVVGGALGGLSVLLAGWPLHSEFLGLIHVIANSLVTCPICYNIDATIAQWLLSDTWSTPSASKTQVPIP